MKRCRGRLSYFSRGAVLGGCVWILLTCFSTSTWAQEEESNFLSSRRTIGLLFLGGGAVLVKKGFDFNQDADDFYDLYKEANDPEQASRFYSRTTNRDVKSQVSWALGAAFAISGARLLLFEDKSRFDGENQSLNLPGARNLQLNTEIDSNKLGLVLKKIWEF